MPAQPIYLTRLDALGAPAGRGFILGVVGFGAPRPAGLDEACPFACVDMQVLGPGPVYEVWTAQSPVEWRRSSGVCSAVSGGTMFGVLRADLADGSGIEAWADAAYDAIFAAADEAGCPHLLRVYNYLPRITETERGTERYRLFNAGRKAAYLRRGQLLGAAPAACALGTRDGGPVVYFVASSVPGRAVENPRQVSAYEYPVRYGSSRPNFSRAMIAQGGQQAHVFISGTASIVGHESLHAGDAAAQTSETLGNFRALFAAVSELGIKDVAENLAMKAYVRRAEDLPRVKACLAVLPAAAQVTYLEADICRQDLLVEIEAFSLAHWPDHASTPTGIA